MERHNPRFQSKPQTREAEREIANQRRKCRSRLTDSAERTRPAALSEQHEHNQEKSEAQMRRAEIPESSLYGFLLLTITYNEEVRRDRHCFPQQKERQDIVGKCYKAHREHKNIE